MSRVTGYLASMMLMIFLAAGVAHSAEKALKHEHREGEVIIKYKKGKGPDTAEVHKRHGLQRLRHYKGLDMEQVRIRPGKPLEEAISELEADADVEYAEPNYIVRRVSRPRG